MEGVNDHNLTFSPAKVDAESVERASVATLFLRLVNFLLM